MSVALLFLIIAIIAGIFLTVVVAVPAVAGYLSNRDNQYKAKYLAERRDKNIAYRALREILSNNGDGAPLIAEIAVNEIDSNEIKELN